MTTSRYREERPMVLRLILIGVLAGLALTVPGKRQFADCGRAAQQWVNARLAEWDAGTRANAAPYVIVADAATRLDPEDERTTPAPEPVASMPALAALATPAPEPIPSTGALASAPAPNEQETYFATELTAETDVELESLDESESELTRLDGQVAQAVTELLSETLVPREPEAPTLDDAFDTIVDEMALAFASDVPSPALAALEPVGEIAWTFFGLESERTLAARETADADFEAVVGDLAASFTADLARMEARQAEESARVTLALWEFDGEDVAGALNRASDGLSAEASGPVEFDSAAPPSHRLTQAVRLTREAMLAWAQLLHGPAVVTISR